MMITGTRIGELNERIRANGVWLEIQEGRLILTDGTLVYFGDFSKMLPRLKKGFLERELLVRAAGAHKKENARLIDATAGMGTDAMLLAAAGWHVTMYEQDPVIAELLADALRRAEEIPGLTEPLSRMTLIEGDSIAALREGPDAEVVCLDPMFPERTKSALVKKKFQLIHRLESPSKNEKELFDAAVSARPERIVVKRPLKGPFLSGRKPTFSITGKAVRYDCYQIQRGGS